MFEGQAFDYMISVCDRAREECPDFPGGQQIHWGLPDPIVIKDDRARMAAFHSITAQLSARIHNFLDSDLAA